MAVERMPCDGYELVAKRRHKVFTPVVCYMYTVQTAILCPLKLTETDFFKTTYGWALFHQKFLYKRIFEFAPTLEFFFFRVKI